MWSGRIKKQKSRSAKNEQHNAWFDYANKYVSKILRVRKYSILVILFLYYWELSACNDFSKCRVNYMEN